MSNPVINGTMPNEVSNRQRHIFAAFGILVWVTSIVIVLVQRYPREGSFFTRYTPLYLAVMVFPCLLAALMFSILGFVDRFHAWVSRLSQNKIIFISAQIILFAAVAVGIAWVFRMPDYLRANWIVLVAVLTTPFLLAGTGIRLVSANTLLIMLSLLLAFALLEGGMRAFPFLVPRTIWQLGHVDKPYQETPTTIYLHSGRLNLPELADVHPVPQDEDEVVAEFIHQTNSLGFRGSGKVPDQVGLIGLGDSFTHAPQVEETWVDLLGKQLALTSLNLGLSGRAPTSEIEPYLKYGVPRSPSLVILGYFEGNDLTAYCPHDPSYQLALGRWDDQLLIRQLPQAFEIAIDTSTRVAEEERMAIEPDRESDSQEYIFPVYATLGGQQIELAFHSQNASTMLISYDDVRRSIQLEAIRNAFVEAQQASDKIGARFVVAYFPSVERVYWPLIVGETDIVTAIYADQRNMWQMTDQPCIDRIPLDRNFMTQEVFVETINSNINGQRDALRDMLAEIGVEFIDLTPAFREAAAQGEVLYYPYDTHWNQAGHQLAADTMATILSEKK